MPPHFEMAEPGAIQDAMKARRLANLVTWTGDELVATLLPLILVRDEGQYGALHGHEAGGGTVAARLAAQLWVNDGCCGPVDSVETFSVCED